MWLTPESRPGCSDFTCAGCARQLEGALPVALADLGALTMLQLGGNSFQGSLPAAWGANGSFPVGSLQHSPELVQGAGHQPRSHWIALELDCTRQTPACIAQQSFVA